MKNLRQFIKTTIRQYLNEEQNSNENIWYHGTNKKFNEFDLAHFGKTDDGWWGVGVYFHSDIDTAKVYGQYIIKSTFNTNKILNLPKENSGVFLYDTLTDLGLNLPIEYENYSAMKIIKNIGKQEFTDFIKSYFDAMIINYVQNTKEAVVFNPSVINIISIG